MYPDFTKCQNTEYIYEKIDLKEFAVDNRVNSIFRDKNNMIWMATVRGLLQYDGHNFYNYNSDNRDSLIPASVDIAFQNVKGEIWVSGTRFLSIFDQTKKHFIHFGKNVFKENIQRAGFHDNEGNIWFLTRQKILKFNTNNRKWNFFDIDISWNNNVNKKYNKYKEIIDSKFNIYIDNSQHIWISDSYKIYHSNETIISKTISFKEIPIISKQPVKLINCIWEESSNEIWLGTDIGIFRKKSTDEAFQRLDKKIELSKINSDVVQINRDLGGLVWVNTLDTIYIFDNKKNKTNKIRYNLGSATTLIYSASSFVFHEKYGYHWSFNGIDNFFKIKKVSNNFEQNRNDPSESNSILDGPIFGIFKDSKQIYWYCGRHGLCKFELNEQKFYRPVLDPSQSLSSNKIRCYSINEDNNGNIWIGTAINGLYKYSENKFSNYFFYPENSNFQSSNYYIRKIFKDSYKRLWFAHLNGVSLLDEKTNSFKNLELIKVTDPFVDQQHIFDIVEDNNKSIWVGGGKELFNIKFNKPDDFIISNYHVKGSIFSMFINKKVNKLFIGTSSEGLGVFDMNNQKFTNWYTIKDGLLSLTIYNILCDEHDNLWLSTSKGISKFDIKNKKFTNFTARDGLDFDDFTTGSKYKDSTGEMYFGTYGVVKFHPDSVRQHIDSTEYPIVLTLVKTQGMERTFQKPLSELSEMVFKKSDTYIELFFSCLDYNFPDDRKYKYKLEGHDDEWIDAGKRNFAVYSNLNVGTYIFRVKAANANDIWSKQELEIKMIIKPENISQEKWFKPALGLLTTLLVLIGIITFFVYRNKSRELSMNKEKENLNNMAQIASMQSLRSQMNPHFLFNVLNSVNSFISKNDKYTANKLLSDFGKLMRYILNNSKKNLISLNDEIEFIKLYLDFEHLRHDNKFDYQLNVNTSISLEKVYIPPMLIQPFLENSVKHGLRPKDVKGLLSVDFLMQDSFLIIKIIDNGIGIDRSLNIKTHNQENKSVGISNVRERIEIIRILYKKKIMLEILDRSISNKNLEGTFVKLKIENPTDWISI